MSTSNVNRADVLKLILKTIRKNIPDANGFQKWSTAYTLALSVWNDEATATEVANELQTIAKWA